MAEANISVAQDQFSCPVCLDLLKDPVTIPCGHSYCMNCITGCWNQDDQKGVYSCPQCRQTFTPRPVLGKNVVFAEVVEKLKKTKLHSAVPAQGYAGLGDVECDICTARNTKQSSPVWCVSTPTVRITLNNMRIFLKVRSTTWWMPWDDYRRWSVTNMINS